LSQLRLGLGGQRKLPRWRSLCFARSASRVDPHEIAEETTKEALAVVRASEPLEVVTRASSSPGPVPGTKADMPMPGTEVGVTAGPLLFGAASGSEKVSHGAHAARTVASKHGKASPPPRATAQGASGGRISRLQPGLALVAKVPLASSKRNGRILPPAPGPVEALRPRVIT
jgi:hypothetical protein